MLLPIEQSYHFNFIILCFISKVLANTYEAYQVLYYGELLYWPPWAEVLSKWNHLMLTINASINIFIYVVKVALFRDICVKINCSNFRISSFEQLCLSSSHVVNQNTIFSNISATNRGPLKGKSGQNYS